MDGAEQAVRFTPGECGVLAAAIRAARDARAFSVAFRGARKLSPEEEAVESNLLRKCEMGCRS